MVFTSYRDPNLSATLDVYKKAADYVRNFEAGKRDMTKYIIGTISGIDRPLEPSALGERSFHAYQSGITVEMIQKREIRYSMQRRRRFVPLPIILNL